MQIARAWAMPNRNTFSIKPIWELINKYITPEMYSIDGFANTSRIATVTNDIDPQYDTDYHLDAYDFFRQFDTASVDAVLYDPPFSPRQVMECYKKLNLTVDWETTSGRYWAKHKSEISRIVKPNGIVISCGWNSGGMGKKYGFEIVEILLVAHGGQHNDTIVVVERRKA